MRGNKSNHVHLWVSPSVVEKWGPIQREVLLLLQKTMDPFQAHAFLRWLAEALAEALGIEHIAQWEGSIDTPCPSLPSGVRKLAAKKVQ